MRISDWSSDVCSSDLIGPGGGIAPVEQRREQRLRGTAVALRGNGTRMHPRRVSSISRRYLRRFGDRAFGIALHQPRLGEQVVRPSRRESGAQRARDLGFGGIALALGKVQPRCERVRQPPALVGHGRFLRPRPPPPPMPPAHPPPPPLPPPTPP